jgi:hypothetical protein
MERSRLLWLLVTGLLASAWLAACTEKPTPRFPHRLHLAELACGKPGQPACLTCNTCHAPSQPDREYKLPPAALCQTCHREPAGDALASLHAVPERPIGEIAIDHDKHLAMPGIGGQCVTCHGGVVEPGKSTLPPMDRCFQCHEHEQQWQRAQCAPCHQSKDLKSSLPRTFLQHDASFLRHHGESSTFEMSLCQTCHTQQDCQACHDVTQDLTAEARSPERVESRSFHRGDFMSRHALEASAAPARCASCHSPQTCDSCHVVRGVSGNAIASRNPHPPGWVGSSAGFKSPHGVEARRDILACASCHDQGPATNCIRCHQVGSYGGNPHPRGWQSARSPSDQMCRYCHGE